jgi:hypothetical protein
MQSAGQKSYKRKEISYFDGLNAAVSNNIAKHEELAHAENARSISIGTVEKREGMGNVGSAVVAVDNYGVFNFVNSGTNNAGIYRAIKVGSTNTIYYMKLFSTAVFTGSGLNDCTAGGTYTGSPDSTTFTIIIDGTGTPDTFKWKKGSGSYTEGVSITGAAQTLSDGLTVTFGATTGHTISAQWVITTNVWTALSGGGTGFDAPTGLFDSCVAEGNLYLVNIAIENRYISGDGTTVVKTSTSGTAHNLVRSPKANLVNYYKGRLYLADYMEGSYRQKNMIIRSSPLLGLVALINTDAATGATSLDITDTKYIVSGEVLDIRRGGTSITTVTVTGINETSITVNTTLADIQASDELWVNGTYAGTGQLFRWVANSSITGTNVQAFDTFKLSGTNDNNAEEIKMMVNVGNNMLIGSNNNLAIWNNYVLRTMDYGIGCVSRRAYTKNNGILFFLHYSGIYQSVGEAPTLISQKIDRYLSGATRSGLESCVAGKKGKSVFFTIGDVTLYNPDGSTEKTLSDVCLEYNTIQQNWYVHTNIKATDFITYISPLNFDRLVMSTSFSNLPVYEFLQSGTYTDNGTEIMFRMDTPNILIGQLFEKISRPHEIAIEMERGSGLKCFISLDMGRWYALEGESSKGLTILKVINKDTGSPMVPRCRNMRISLRHAGKMLCKISKLAINYEFSAEEETEKPDETQPIPISI